MIFIGLAVVYLAVGLGLYVSDARMYYMDRPAYISRGSVLVKGIAVVVWPWVLYRRLSYPKVPTPSGDAFDRNDPSAWDTYGMQHIRMCNQIHQRHEQLFSLQSAGDCRASTERKRERVKERLRGHYSEAVAAFEQALKLDPKARATIERLGGAKAWLERLRQ